MSKKTKIEHDLLADRPEFKGLTREQLLSLSSLPTTEKKGIIGKYHMRVVSSAERGTFCTPSWSFGDKIIKLGPFAPKTKRGIFDHIRQAVALFGDEGLTGEQIVRFIHQNLDMVDQRSPYTDGQPCVPWIEDYIAGAIAEKNQYLIAVDPSTGEQLATKKKEVKKAS